jgi:Tol biopolymer transport system component
MVSVASDGTHGNWNSASDSISADGRYVVFSSDANNLVDGDTNVCDLTMTSFGCHDVFVRDRAAGMTTRISVSSDGTEGTQASWGGSISADGQYVAFSSRAEFAADDTNFWEDAYVHDQDSGETMRVSVASNGDQAEKGGGDASISADGGYIGFGSESPDLVDGDTNESRDVFLHDLQTGETTRISVASDGTQGDNSSWNPTLSADGRFVAFGSRASNLVVGDGNNSDDVFIHDRVTGETTLVSLSWDGSQGNHISEDPSISADGRYVVFESSASNLVVGDTNTHCDLNYDYVYDENCPDIFVRDREGTSLGYLVSGHVTDLDGNPLPGVTIFNSYGITTTTDIQGDYTFPILPSGTYWLTALIADYTFVPIHHETSVPPDRVEINFTEGFFAILPLIHR